MGKDLEKLKRLKRAFPRSSHLSSGCRKRIINFGSTSKTLKVKVSQAWDLKAKFKSFNFLQKIIFLTIKKKISVIAGTESPPTGHRGKYKCYKLPGHTMRLRKQPDPRQRDESLKQTGWGGSTHLTTLGAGRQEEVLVLVSPGQERQDRYGSRTLVSTSQETPGSLHCN